MTDYANDVPDINEETTAEELIEYTEKRIREPIVINGTIIWNFSSHEVDRQALKEAVEGKLVRDKYMVPFQVSGAWSFMMTLLPQPVREAEILIYRNNLGEYYAYQNYNREIPEESRKEIQQKFAEITRKQ